MPNSIPRFNQVDSLRGIAALMVILVHANSFGYVDYFPALLGRFVFQGARGVQLFYILSAFTLFYTFDQRKTDTQAIRNFLIRRFFRIAPLYYVAIGLYVIYAHVGLPADTCTAPGIWPILSNLFFVHGFSPFWINDPVPGGWSIGVEFPFYFLLPFLFARIKSLKDALRFLVGCMVIAIVLPILMLEVKGVATYDVWISFITQFFPNQLSHFAFGIVLYFLIIKKEGFTREHLKYLYILTILYFTFASLSLYYLQYDWPVLTIILSFWFSLGFSVLIFLLFQDQTFKFDQPVLLYLGKVSYGLYLTHFFGYYLLEQFGLLDLMPGDTSFAAFINFAIRFVLCLGISTVLASLLHFTVEKPFQKLGKKIIFNV